MKRYTTSLAIAALLSTPLAAAPTAAAHRPATMQSADQHAEAAQALVQQLEALTARNAPVTELRRPAMAALLRQVFDLNAIRALPDDPQIVLARLRSVVDAYQALFAFAAGKGGNDGARLLLAQDEVVNAARAVDLGGKRGFQTANGFIARLDSEARADDRRRHGIRQMQDGYRGVIGGMLNMQSDPGLSAANRTSLIDGMFEDIDIAIDGLRPEDRAAIRADILQFAGRASAPIRARLQTLAKMFERTSCTGLCAFSRETG